METVSLADVLDKNGAPVMIDYLSLDTEGTEHIILGAFPFDRYQFRVVTVEAVRCNDLLAAHGYRHVANPRNTSAPWEQYFVGLVHDQPTQ
jgi:methyltransferase FkbM-like protein